MYAFHYRSMKIAVALCKLPSDTNIALFYPNIKITWDISDKRFEFLDIAGYRHRGRVVLKTHQKRLNSYLYIPFNSYHTLASKKGWISSELSRYIIHSSRRIDFLKTASLRGEGR